MINLEDYKSYLLQNYNLLEDLKASKSLIFDRFADVLKVLGFIEERVERYQKIEEEFEVIFEVGFSYFYEQLEEVKNFIHLYFQKDLVSLKKYEELINYNLYLTDLTETLKEKSQYTADTKTTILQILEEIETIVSERREFNDEILHKFNNMLQEYVPVGTQSTQEIFALISEELDISF
ncbi:MAG: hypothetical protein GX661_00935 [Acholeplasmataceae bacterium]|nr:hypothetical protein [Acholeplasmataceae bacterium]